MTDCTNDSSLLTCLTAPQFTVSQMLLERTTTTTLNTEPPSLLICLDSLRTSRSSQIDDESRPSQLPNILCAPCSPDASRSSKLTSSALEAARPQDAKEAAKTFSKTTGNLSPVLITSPLTFRPDDTQGLVDMPFDTTSQPSKTQRRRDRRGKLTEHARSPALA
jgi:hypothetical protein